MLQVHMSFQQDPFLIHVYMPFILHCMLKFEIKYV